MPDSLPNAAASPPSKRQIFIVRLRSTLVLWTIIGLSIWSGIDWLIAAVVAGFGFLTAVEYARMEHDDAGFRSQAWFAIALSFLYWVVSCVQIFLHHTEPPWWVDAAVFVAAVQGAFVIALLRQLEGRATLLRIFNAVFITVYGTLLFGFMQRLFFFDGMPSARYLALTIIMVTKFADVGAYGLGSIFGRHKMIPHISPAKSWEGLAGAFIFSTAAMICMMVLVPEKLAPLTWRHAMILAPLLCISGVVGDLAESVLKRCHGIKDSGHRLPGIGGILDLTDSVLFTAPVAYLYLKAIS